MKVIQINAVYNLGSTGRTTAELHNALLNNGIESYVAYSNTNKSEDKNLYHIGSTLDVKIHGLLSRISGKQGYFSHLATRDLIKFIDEINPDVVHLRNLHGNYINLPMLMKYLAEKKISVVITFHDFWFVTGKCVHFTTSKCNKWQYKCGNCPNLQDGNRTWFFDKTEELLADKTQMLSKIDKLALIGVSKWTTNEICKSPISRYAKVVKTIYNWIDFDKFHPCDTSEVKSKYQLEDKFTVIGSAFIWGERKGLKDFIELAKARQDINIILLGKIPEGTALPKNIKALGVIGDVYELAALYTFSDAFITFSLEETFGKVSAEALSCGTPVICYNSTACPEIVGDGCGYICEKKNFNQVLDSIRMIEKNGKVFYTDNCVKYAQDNFDKTQNIAEYIQLYRQLSE